jgi:hypothetical protein
MPGMFRPYAAWRSSCRGTLPDLRKASLKGVGRRFVLLLIAVSVPLAGCGASAGTVHRRPVRTEVFVGNQHVFSFDRFVVRTADNTRFLVPARLDPAATDFIHPGSVNVAPSPSFPSRTTTPGFDASTGATIERPYHVEVIATGPVGTSVDIFWEETCGSHRDGGGPAVSGGTGGEGQERARLPAVLAVKLPQWSSGEDSCYVTSTLLTNHFRRGLSVQLVNY